MSANTTIEWTDRTWNPVRGCSIVSPGCVNCYAMKQAHRFSAAGKAYHGLTKQTKAGPQWTGKVVTVEDALLEPLSWRKPARVFVNSMSDLFHDDVPDAFIDQVFATMAAAHDHTFQILTKRPQRMWAYLADVDVEDRIHLASLDRYGHTKDFDSQVDSWVNGRWPLPNVWLGVSCENQQTADERIPLLLQTPAAVRWASAEPLIGPIDFARIYPTYDKNPRAIGVPREPWTVLKPQREDLPTVCLDWVVVGGESGPGARPFDLAWGRGIVQQCQAAGVPVFVKQLGALPFDYVNGSPDWPGDLRAFTTNIAKLDAISAGQNGRMVNTVANQQISDRKGGDPSEWPEDLRVREWPV